MSGCTFESVNGWRLSALKVHIRLGQIASFEIGIAFTYSYSLGSNIGKSGKVRKNFKHV